MICTDEQLIQYIREMIEMFENEVVEFKEAKLNYSFQDIVKYFSEFGNEANIRGKKESWLIFGECFWENGRMVPRWEVLQV